MSKELEAKIKALEEENEAMKNSLESAKATGIVSPPVPGVFTCQLEQNGKSVTKKFKFRDGCLRVPLSNGLQVSSELLIKLANGGELTEEDLVASPHLNGVTKGNAIERLTHLVSIGASYLIEQK